jgi:hypothetical protein
MKAAGYRRPAVPTAELIGQQGKIAPKFAEAAFARVDSDLGDAEFRAMSTGQN